MAPPDTQPLRLYAVTPARAVPLPLPGEGEGGGVHDLFDGLPLGIYEGTRTYGRTRFLHLERHLDRADAGLAALGWAARVDRPALRAALDAATRAWPLPEARVRFDVLAEPVRRAGVETRTLLALGPLPPLPPGALERGVDVGVARDARRARPRIKLASWVVERRDAGGEAGCYEHLLLDEEGRVLEGTSSNVFGVDAGTLVTAETGVLEGLMRRTVLELAAERGVPVRFERLPLPAFAALDEAFLTSSSRGPVPIATVAGRPIGARRPGPRSLELRAAWEALAAREARPALG